MRKVIAQFKLHVFAPAFVRLDEQQEIWAQACKIIGDVLGTCVRLQHVVIDHAVGFLILSRSRDHLILKRDLQVRNDG